MMASEAECCPLGVFKCQLCSVTAPYSYVGQKPPNTQAVVLLEESYVMKDPFTSGTDRFLVLGSRCSLCSRLDNISAFPREIQQDVEKRKGPKRPSSQPCP
nr:cysteine-rich DPF motif domain-containing protein 1 isoform X6 [Marmota flaviventris]